MPSVFEIKERKSALFFMLSKDDDIVLRPIKSRPKPMIIIPADCSFLLLENIFKIVPKNTAIGAISEKLKAIIRLVTVVPMLAPITMPTAPDSDSIPALTRDTAVTVVAQEL